MKPSLPKSLASLNDRQLTRLAVKMALDNTSDKPFNQARKEVKKRIANLIN